MVPERDLDRILEVEGASFSSPWTREMYLWEIQNSDVARVYVLRLEGHDLAAFCSVWLIFDELHINNLAVHPKFRRQGLASALLRHVLEEGARHGARRATLEVRQSNAVARHLYERMGFFVYGTRSRYYRNPEEDALVLWRVGLDSSSENVREARRSG